MRGADDTSTRMVVHRYDRVLLGVTFVLMGLGVLMVYSASIVSSEVRFDDSAYYLKRQLVYVVLALGALVAMLNLHHDALRRLARPILIGGVILLVLVLLPGISASAKGAARWIGFGFFRVQPSELIKIGWVIFLAEMLSRRQSELDGFRVAWGGPVLVVGVIGALLMKQPDFGSTMICGALMMLMVWSAGGRWLHATGLLLGGLGLAAAAVFSSPYRMDRVTAFLHPERDPLGTGFHINQALISFGSGEWTGLGLGASRQKLMYLPEAHTDFIFSILGEELGLVGVAAVMVLFAIFVWRGFKIARNASSSFGALLAFGLTGLIGFQAAINMAVATALLPTKGLTLPFISYGGSSLITAGAAVGMLLNISRCTPPPAWMHERLPEPKTKTGRRRVWGFAL